MSNPNYKSTKETIETKKLEQFLANINVISELSKPKPELSILKQYNGFGGLKSCFNSKQLYGMLMHNIRNVFGRELESEVFTTLKNSCSSAYYTPQEVVIFIYRYLEQVCGFTHGDILEPSCGNGVFFEHMPEAMLAKSNITGVEMDLLTSKLVKSIYPKVNIINQPLQDVDFSDKKYDLIIGNPPYSAELVSDKCMPDISNYTIHHYFTAKCIGLLKDNGILVFVLPSYFMDIPGRNTRAIINNEAVLIDAVRLPENLFEQATVTVDILFFRKTGKKIHNFTKSVVLTQDDKKDNVNEFWQANPHRILGELKLKWVEAYKRYVPTCETTDIDKVLNFLVNCKFDDSTKANYANIITRLLDDFKQRLLQLNNIRIGEFGNEITQLISLLDKLEFKSNATMVNI